MTSHDENNRGFALRLAVFYGAIFVVYGLYVPFMPLWLDWKGLSASEISLVIAAPLFLRVLVTPPVAMAADRNRTHRNCLVVLAWAALGSVLVLTISDAFWPILLFAVLLTICNSTIMPLIDTIAVQGARARGLDYGRMRLWGSLSFIGASFAGGTILTASGRGIGIWLIALGCLLTVMAAHWVPKDEKATAPAADEVAKHTPIWHAAEPRELLANKTFRTFLIAAGLTQAAHATLFTFGTLIWQGDGISAAWCGALWAIGVLAEVLLFSISGSVCEKFGAGRLLVLGAAFSVFRWVALAFQPTLSLLVPLQLLHGITYGATHLGAMHFIRETVPHAQAGSAQALYATVSAGVAMGAATLIAGFAYAEAGALSYLAMGAISAIAFVAAFRLARLTQERGATIEV